MTTFGDRLYQLGGIPVGLGGGLIPATTGNIFFVDSGATGTKIGDSPVNASLTIDAAVGKCTANNGDIIFVLPGHAENIVTATSLVIDVAGISIIGIGQGKSKPVLTFTAVGGSIEIDAANCRLSNLILLTSVDAVVVGINVDNNDIELDHIEFRWDDTGDDFDLMMDVEAFDRTRIHDCIFLAENVDGCSVGVRIDDAHATWIQGCIFMGDFNSAAISGTHDSAATSDGLLITSNIIYNVDNQSANIIDLHDNATGFIAHNRIGTEYNTNVTNPLDPGEGRQCENYVANDDDETGGQTSVSS